MSGPPAGARTRVVLSFSRAFRELATDLGDDLRAAGILVDYDPWEGGGGAPATRAVEARIEGAACVLVLLTRSDAATTWLGEEWKRAVFDPARALEVPVLPVRGGEATTPAYLSGLSYADIHNRDRDVEVAKLVERVRKESGDPTIRLPASPADDDRREGDVRPQVAPVTIELGSALTALVEGDDETRPFEATAGPMMRDGLFFELGVPFPGFRLEVDAGLPPTSARILVNGVPEKELVLRPDRIMVNDTAARLADAGFTAEATVNPVNGAPAAFLPVAECAAAEASGLVTWDTTGCLILPVSAILRTKAADFIGVDAAKGLLAQVSTAFPVLVAETVPKTVSWFVLTDVLRRLVAEGVSIRNLRRLLMSLADWGRIERDPLMLTEYVRAGLKRQLTHKFGRGSGTLVVFLLDPDLEELIRERHRHEATGSYVDLEPERIRRFVDSVRDAMRALGAGVQLPRILTTMEIRAPVRRLLAPAMPHVHAISYQEVLPRANIQPVGRIGLDGYTLKGGITVHEATLKGPRDAEGRSEA